MNTNEHEENEIVPKKGTGEILKDTGALIAAGITGAVSSGKKDLSLSAGRIFQAFIKGRGLDQLKNEWDSFVEEGKIKDNYEATSQHRDCLMGLLDFLDNDCPDEVRFQTLKKIFLVAATETSSDRESVLPYEYMKLCRSMSSGEIITMLAAYNLLNEKKGVSKTDANFQNNWIVSVMNKASLEHRELVEIYKSKLIEKGILMRHPQYSGSLGTNHANGLTTLGVALCKYIESYEDCKKQRD
ncbi:hypothetical protein KAR91_08180 [Candidatus Pacearchaeota archaeon]|nr:hypothetical protein [Candidatus Pacearchaeota archaeon]